MRAVLTLGPLLLLFVALATWVAWLADRHGRSFWTYFVFCLVFPLAVLPASLFLLTRRRTSSR